MLMAAFFGYLTGFALHSTIGSGPALLLGVLVAVLVGALLGLLHAWLTISVRADQIIAGTMMNIAALGMTGYLNRLIITPSGLGGAGVISPFNLPDAISGIPIIGPVLVMFFEQGPIAMASIHRHRTAVALFRTRWVSERACGRAPEGRGHRGHRRLPPALPERHPRRPRGLAGAFITLESTGHSRTG